MKYGDKNAGETVESAQQDAELSPSKRELLKKAWVAPVAVTLASLPLGQVESGTTTTLPP